MPIHEYDCSACGKRSEHLARNADDVPLKCPYCGDTALVKALSAFSVAGQQKAAAPPSACSGCPASSCPHSR